MFHVGFLLISLISFSANSVFSSFVYLLVYVLAMSGVYTAFLGLKSKGIYLDELKEISGLSKVKPYIAAACLLFMVSLIGSPPMLGFLGKLSVINNLVLEQNYILVAAVLVSLILIANGYLRMAKFMYFDSPVNNFDRTDRGIYVFLFVDYCVLMCIMPDMKDWKWIDLPETGSTNDEARKYSAVAGGGKFVITAVRQNN